MQKEPSIQLRTNDLEAAAEKAWRQYVATMRNIDPQADLLPGLLLLLASDDGGW